MFLIMRAEAVDDGLACMTGNGDRHTSTITVNNPAAAKIYNNGHGSRRNITHLVGGVAWSITPGPSRLLTAFTS